MAMTPEQEASFEALLDTVYRKDIAAFALDIFESELRPKQVEFCEAFQKNKRISFKGGVGFGKTHVLAVCVWWALFCCERDTKVSIFGPTENQLTNGIWNEIELLYNRMPVEFQEGFDFSATTAQRKANPAACYATWRTIPKDNVGSIAGIHADNNFIFVDEAADVEDIAFEKALQNHLTTDINPKLVLISNPRKASGFFYETWTGDISDSWTKVHGRMQDNPRVSAEDLEYAAKQYGGKGSNNYTINVEGDFPSDNDEGLIAGTLVDLAIENDEVGEPSPARKKIWGVDPAGPGKDRSVIVKRHDNHVYEMPLEYTKQTITQLSYTVRDMWQRLPKHERDQVIIAVDANGLGRGLYDNLRDFGLPVKSVTTQSSPTKGRDAFGNDKFAKLRDQLWWQVKEWIETENVRLPYCLPLIKELKMPSWAYDAKGKVKVEGKSEIKKRLKASPDYADALCLTFAVEESRYSGKYSWSKPISGTNHSAYE